MLLSFLILTALSLSLSACGSSEYAFTPQVSPSPVLITEDVPYPVISPSPVLIYVPSPYPVYEPSPKPTSTHKPCQLPPERPKLPHCGGDRK